MDNIDIFLRAALTGFSLLLFLVSAVTYWRIRSQRLLFVCLAFALFFVKGLLLTVGIFSSSVNEMFAVSTQVILLDFAIMMFLYLGIAKRESKRERQEPE
ncbi:MAG: hypothetical protein L0213_02520 [Candidatus Dadabacteria bacterium]|nr:hypothetical protein [Candidatus Dadabacteria bacterium]